jgi:hypothetical protein
MHQSGTGYAYVLSSGSVPIIEKGQQMGYAETVLAVCAGVASFVCFGVAAAYAAAWILDGIDHK